MLVRRQERREAPPPQRVDADENLAHLASILADRQHQPHMAQHPRPFERILAAQYRRPAGDDLAVAFEHRRAGAGVTVADGAAGQFAVEHHGDLGAENPVAENIGAIASFHIDDIQSPEPGRHLDRIESVPGGHPAPGAFAVPISVKSGKVGVETEEFGWLGHRAVSPVVAWSLLPPVHLCSPER